MIASLVDRMIAAGLSPGEAGSIAAELYAAGAASVAFGSSNAERQKRYRDRKKRNESVTPNVTNRNETVTERNADTVTQTVTNRNETVTSNASAILPREKISKKDSRQDSKRGTRIDPAWTASAADRETAKAEGFSDSEIDREAMRFRDFWTGKAGAGGVKLDWASTWRNWVRNSADRLGKAPTSSGSVPTASDKLDWDAILQTYKKIGIWSKWAGPDLSSPACRAPRELLEKYGLLADGRTIQ